MFSNFWNIHSHKLVGLDMVNFERKMNIEAVLKQFTESRLVSNNL